MGLFASGNNASALAVARTMQIDTDINYERLILEIIDARGSITEEDALAAMKELQSLATAAAIYEMWEEGILKACGVRDSEIMWERAETNKEEDHVQS